MKSRRGKRWQRYLSMVLAAALMLSSVSTGWAQEISPAETQTAETAAPETKVPETRAAVPETKAPETQATAPETKAPETQAAAPETKASETQATAPETKAPETQAAAPETKTPETLPSDTKGADTEAQTLPQTAETSATETAGAQETEPAAETDTKPGAAEESSGATQENTESETAPLKDQTEETKTGEESETAATETEAPKTWFTYEDERVKITAEAQEEGKLPQEAQLRADYIAPGTAAYNEAVEVIEAQLLVQLGAADKNTQVEYTIYDVYFLLPDGSRIEPEAGDVKVEMTFKQLQTVEAEGKIINKDVVHIKENGQAEIVTDYVNTNGDGEVTSMGFTQDSFSRVAVASTFSGTTAEVLASGTDSPEFSADLNRFIKDDIVVTGGGVTIDSNGNLVMDSGATYSFKLKFAETDQLQFSNDKNTELIYVLPDGLIPIVFTNTEKFPISITTADKKIVEFKNNTYRIGLNQSTNKYEIVVKFDTEHLRFNDVFTRSDNVFFELSFAAQMTLGKDTTEIKFSESVKKNVIIRNDHSLSVEKLGEYDKENGKFDYTVTVKATGYNKNIILTDTLAGSVLTLQKDSVKEWESDKEAAVKRGELTTSDDKGFTYKIPYMNNGETLVLKYSSKVDYAGLNGAAFFSEDTTKNIITGTSDDITEPKTAETYSTEKAYETTPDKTGEVDPSDVSKTLINWTITVNEDMKASVAGKMVTDELTNLHELPAKYAGNGIKVQIFKRGENGSPEYLEEESISWETLGVNTKESTGWSFPLPQKQPDGAYMYKITYQTKVDNSMIVATTYSKNRVTVGDIHWTDFKDAEVGILPPDGSTLSVRKSHEDGSITKKEAIWTITIKLPQNGLADPLEINDTMPRAKDGTIKDKFAGIESVKLITDGKEELISRENGNKLSYKLEEWTDYGMVWICFGKQYKEFEYYEPTEIIKSMFSPSDYQRVLEIKLKTTPDTTEGGLDTWPDGYTRKNEVNIYTTGIPIRRPYDYDIYRYPRKEIKKA